MYYLEYELESKLVVDIQSTEIIPSEGYNVVMTDIYQPGDEFSLSIYINEVNEDNQIVSHSAIRNNPQSARLLKENSELKALLNKKNANDDFLSLDTTKVNLDLLKTKKIEQLDYLCNQEILDGFISDCLGESHLYGFSMEDQSNLQGTLALMNTIASLEEVQWKTKDAGILPHNREQFIMLCADSFAHKQSNIVKYWELKGKVENAKTKKEVLAIIW